MRNIIKDIEDNCKECDTKEVVQFLFDRGDFSFTSEYHRDIWHSYLKICEEYETKAEAVDHVCSLYKIHPRTFDKIRAKYRKKPRSPH